MTVELVDAGVNLSNHQFDMTQRHGTATARDTLGYVRHLKMTNQPYVQQYIWYINSMQSQV